MNTLPGFVVSAVLIVLIFCVNTPTDAQVSRERSVRDKPSVNIGAGEAKEAPGARVQAQPARGGMRLQSQPATPLSMCCGSVDTEANVGANCAKLAAGKTCGGDILSCPPTCEENIGPDGTGGCYCP